MHNLLYAVGIKLADSALRLNVQEKKMKLLAALIFGLSSSALAANGNEASLFNFNQPKITVQLEHQDFETIYRTDQVPDTCYRDEIQGTKTECRTVYDQVCNTRMEQVCNFRTYPVCNTIPRRVCYSRDVCTTQMDQVCNSHGCQTIPRRVCNPQQYCTTQMDQVCHHEQRYECQTLPRQYCQDVPRQDCQQVPNVVKVAYACTRPVQVPIGQQLKLHTVAQVTLQLANFAESGPTADQLRAELKDGKVTLTALDESSSAYLYQILDTQKQEQIISATEKQLNYNFVIKAISLQKLNAFLSSSITHTKLMFDRIEFNFFGKLDIPFKGSLLLVQNRKILSDRVVINNEFSPSAITGQDGNYSIALSPFGVASLKNSKHTGELSLSLDLDRLKTGLINPLTLNGIANKKIESSIDAFPSN